MSIENPLKGQANDEALKQEESHLIKIPNTPIVGEISTLLTHISNIKKDTQKAGDNIPVTISLAQSTTITSTQINKEIMKDDSGNKERKNFLQVEFVGTKSKSIFSITNVNMFNDNNKPISKILFFLICKTTHVAMSAERELTSNYFSFDVQELVERGMYSTTSNACRAINKIRDTIPQIKVRGTLKVSAKRELQFPVDEPFFTSVMKPKKGIVIVGINQNLNWKEIAQFFSAAPDYIYSLKLNAFTLCQRICYLARQDSNMKSIKRNNSFTIKIRQIQQLLDLPNETSTEHPKQLILDVIEKAVKEIQETDIAQEEKYGEIYRCFDLKLVFNSCWSPTDILDRGYLEISPLKLWKQYFENQAKTSQAKKEKAIAIATKKKEAKEAEKNKTDTSTK